MMEKFNNNFAPWSHSLVSIDRSLLKFHKKHKFIIILFLIPTRIPHSYIWIQFNNNAVYLAEILPKLVELTDAVETECRDSSEFLGAADSAFEMTLSVLSA